MTNETRMNHAILLISIAVLPFAMHITRFEANEAHRAGLLGILILFVVPFIPKAVREVKSHQKLLLYAIGFWCVVLVLSTVFSIHPLRSFIGSGLRRKGLLTHLTLVVGAFLVWRTSGKQLWYFFWVVSVLGAVEIVVESQLLENAERITGLLGWTTYTGGWLAVSTLWAVLGFIRQGYQDSSNLQRGVVIGSWLVIGLAFMLLGARASMLSLGAGLFLAGLIWAVLTGRRLILGGLIVVTVLSVSGISALSQIDWGDSALSKASLFQRLDFQVFDPFRQQVWQESQQIMIENPQLIRYDGELDSLHALRPLIGYGAEAFEPPYRMVKAGSIQVVEDELRTDRAHNIWYDTYIMHGWLGVIAIIMLYGAILTVSLKQLKLLNRWTVIDIAGGAILALLLTWGTQFIPMAITFGMIGGLLVGILQSGLTTRFECGKDIFPTRTWLALSILIAHIIEIQFGFVTIATSWIPWLAIGLLLFNTDEEVPSLTIPNWVWLTIAGAFIIRMPLDHWTFNGVLLLVALGITILWSRLSRNQWITLAIIWGGSALNWMIPDPQLAVLWDVVLLLIMLWMFYGSQAGSVNIDLTPKNLLLGLFIILAIGIWSLDILAGIHRLQAETFVADERIEHLGIAVRLRPYDERLWYEAGSANLDFGIALNDGKSIGNAIFQLEQAVHLHGYYGPYVARLANLEVNLALGTDNFEEHALLARQYFEHSTQMWSQSSEFWREWARFEWEIMDDVEKAVELIEEALRLSPNNESAKQLKTGVATLCFRLMQQHSS
jgi:hypothetical protein